MPVASADVWKILYTVSRYLFPLLAVSLVFLVLFFILSESRVRREKVHNLPGSGTVGELIVLSGSRDLDVNTWFPVPREGVLGSVRSCDLVIPCPGVHTKHLDFSWQDGAGLLIHPRTGCEALINGVPVTCRTRPADVPLTHGAVLQVGSAVLRLHLFAALDSTVSAFQPLPEELPTSADPAAAFMTGPAQAPDYVPPTPYYQNTVAPGFTPTPVPPDQAHVADSTQLSGVPDRAFAVPEYESSVHNIVTLQQLSSSEYVALVHDVEAQPPSSSESDDSPTRPPVSTRRRRSDRWKEDLGE